MYTIYALKKEKNLIFFLNGFIHNWLYKDWAVKGASFFFLGITHGLGAIARMKLCL